MKYVVNHAGEDLEVELKERDDGSFDLVFGDRTLRADLRRAGGNSLFSLILEQEAYEVSVVRAETQTRVALRGLDLVLQVESEQERNARLVDAAQGGGGAQTVKSVMPGIVTKVLVNPGEAVTNGTPLLILEAMKMENEIRSPGDGTVSKVHVSEGQTVNGGDALVAIE